MPNTPSPIRPTDNEARQITRDLIANARFGSLAVLHPDTGLPHVTRIAIGTSPSGTPLTLISDLSFHTKALRHNPNCSLLLGEPAANGDPLVHPRISIQCKTSFLARNDAKHADIRAHYLASRPKSKLYIDFADFNFVLFYIQSASLNGGFGKAYELTAKDCTAPTS
ncbi:MAG: pyridoxamine 5'-phosphate oxidase family protein [Amylibacter sp.]|nr:pyridoxamine 5'-phosphate oxidase family protein [Amylibacter sp.]